MREGKIAGIEISGSRYLRPLPALHRWSGFCFDADFFAEISEAALLTMRRGAGRTDLSAVPDQAVAEVAAFLGRNDLPERLFYLGRFLNLIHQTHAVDQANAVGVGDDGRLAEYIAHN